jgi:hypothetical protein
MRHSEHAAVIARYDAILEQYRQSASSTAHTEAIDKQLQENALAYAAQGRSVYVRFSGGQQLRIDAEGIPFSDVASDKQMAYIASLSDSKGVVAPDGPLTKVQASEVIDSLQNGSYDPDKWTVPF